MATDRELPANQAEQQAPVVPTLRQIKPLPLLASTAPTSATTLTDLSAEILAQVVEYVQEMEMDDEKPRKATLRALCLTSKLLNKIATRVLYLNIDLRYNRISCIRPLLRTLSNQEALRNYVQTLHIQTDTKDLSERQNQFPRLDALEIEQLLANPSTMSTGLLDLFQRGAWIAENALLFFLTPNLRYLNICMANLRDLVAISGQCDAIMRIMLGVMIQKSRGSLPETFDRLQGLRVYPHHGLEQIGHFPIGWSILETFAKSETLRDLSVVGIRGFRQSALTKVNFLDSITSITLINTSIGDDELFELLLGFHYLENICVRWAGHPHKNNWNDRVPSPLLPTSFLRGEQGLHLHAPSLRCLVLESSRSRYPRSDGERHPPKTTYVGSLRFFCALESLELDGRFLYDGEDLGTDSTEDLHYRISQGLCGVLPKSLKSFTLHSRGCWDDAYNMLALATPSLPPALEHVCVSFVVVCPDTAGTVDFYIPFIEQDSNLSAPADIQLRPVDYSSYSEAADFSHLTVGYRGPDLFDKLSTLRMEWRPRALEILEAHYENDDSP